MPSIAGTATPTTATTRAAVELLAKLLDEWTMSLDRVGPGQRLRSAGEGGLSQGLTKRFVEAALEGEMDAHPGLGRNARGTTS